jgi:ribose 5-phosphate isomerase B
VGSDCISHLTGEITRYLESKGHQLERCGALAGQEADYVDAACAVAEAVSEGRCQQGLIFCNTGTGVTIIANKHYGVRAALCPDSFSARIARLANNANVIVLGLRLTGEPHAKEIVDSWLETEPSTEPRRVNFHRKTEELDRRLRAGGKADGCA